MTAAPEMGIETARALDQLDQMAMELLIVGERARFEPTAALAQFELFRLPL